MEEVDVDALDRLFGRYTPEVIRTISLLSGDDVGVAKEHLARLRRQAALPGRQGDADGNIADDRNRPVSPEELVRSLRRDVRSRMRRGSDDGDARPTAPTGSPPETTTMPREPPRESSAREQEERSGSFLRRPRSADAATREPPRRPVVRLLIRPDIEAGLRNLDAPPAWRRRRRFYGEKVPPRRARRPALRGRRPPAAGFGGRFQRGLAGHAKPGPRHPADGLGPRRRGSPSPPDSDWKGAVGPRRRAALLRQASAAAPVPRGHSREKAARSLCGPAGLARDHPERGPAPDGHRVVARGSGAEALGVQRAARSRRRCRSLVAVGPR
ncbi:hypothetical protein THAOC_30655 [Thalassiosira oceanica]|uniref:Uncharacterized protein n=1 Tax=Thalassiosira oceanica TaxID=159749 RepID=K0RUM2_THAOC|nr:hypothetical protein THAOC_30655 [Thalassiosira oceanica]|eukprot:EJK50382.1 hypothetical protein THAOC_30655 [Thalassiosira oceanica]